MPPDSMIDTISADFDHRHRDREHDSSQGKGSAHADVTLRSEDWRKESLEDQATGRLVRH
jgi:hypothetical protein